MSIRNKERYSIIEELERQRLQEFKQKDSKIVNKYKLEASKFNVSIVPPPSVYLKPVNFQSQINANLASVSTNIAYESYKDSNIGNSH